MTEEKMKSLQKYNRDVLNKKDKAGVYCDECEEEKQTEMVIMHQYTDGDIDVQCPECFYTGRMLVDMLADMVEK